MTRRRTWQQERADVVAWLESRAFYAGGAHAAGIYRQVSWQVKDGKHVRHKRSKRRKR